MIEVVRCCTSGHADSPAVAWFTLDACHARSALDSYTERTQPRVNRGKHARVPTGDGPELFVTDAGAARRSEPLDRGPDEGGVRLAP